MHLCSKRQPAHLRHFNIGYQDIGLVLRDQCHCLTAVARPRHHGNVFLDLEQSGERA
jgi:hypothetical protein